MDPFASLADTASTPARKHFAIVPDDDEDLDVLPKAIYCQAAGTVVIMDEEANSLPYAMTAGQILPFRGTRIMATGTTGTYYGWF